MMNQRSGRRRPIRNVIKSWLPSSAGLTKRNLSAAHRNASSGLSFERLEDRLALTVVINEILAENDDGHRDFNGHQHDWLELKNTGAVAQDISGWYLTDDSADLTKYQIPPAGSTTTLEPGEILLVYASGSNGEIGLLGSELHTNFQLSQEIAYLGLVQSDGSTIEDEFNLYPQQFPDISYGLGVGVESTTTETLLSGGTPSAGDGSPAKFRPLGGPIASVDDHWTEIDYVASASDGWSDATNGLGFGYGSPWQDNTVSLSGEISAYVRLPFSVTNKAALTSMNLDLRVDNGYILFLNGREVKRERLATDHKIGNDWELNSRQNLDDSILTGTPAEIDLTPWLDTIEEGDNVLAIYGANHTSDTGDFLVHAELTAERANGVVADTFMVTPTPGEENGAGYAGIIEDTVFSHDRGFYDATFPLTITTAEPNTTIRYTTDGTMPTLTNGTTYTSPLTIDPTTLSYTDAGVVTVRAAAFKSGYYSSNVDTQSYIFLDEVLDQDGSGLPAASSWGHAGADWELDPSIVAAVGAANFKDDLKSIPTMSLVMDWQELFGDGSSGDGDGIYTQSSSWRDKSDERYASLEYFTEGLTEEFQVDTTVEIQGHSSANRWRSDKLSFEVKFKQPYDTKLDSDTLFGNSVADGANAATSFDSLVLDAQYNYAFSVNNTTTQGPYATFIHDQVVADLQNLAGGQAPHGRWVHLYINGLYWGVYNAHEKPSDSFAMEYNGGDKDDYLVVKGFDGIGLSHGGGQDKYIQADGGLASQNAYADLLDKVDENLSSLAQYQEVKEILDIDSFIDYMVIHYYAGNYDWGENNWYASLDSVDPDGQWHFHSWDQEHAFPNDQNGPSANGNYAQDYDHTLQVAGDFGEHEFGPTGIHHKLMSSEEYRLRFSDRVESLMQNDGLLTPAKAQAVWLARVGEVSAAMNGETARWGDNRSSGIDENTWATNVQYTADNFFFANGAFQSRTDETIDIFNNTSGVGVGKIDWLVNLDAPILNQFGGQISAPFNLTLTNSNGSGTIYYTLDGTDPRDEGGAISASAIAYTGAISLTDSTQVRTRVFDGGQSGTANDWSAEVSKVFTVTDSSALRIVELMYNPAAGDLEYIELLNAGNTSINLEGVQITDFSTGGYTFASQSLAAGQRIVVAENTAAFQAEYPTVANLAATAYSGGLSNGGELISLRDRFGTLLQSFTYDDDGMAGWPTTPDGGGPSLEYIGPLNAGEDPADGSPADPFDDPSNWQASAVNGGTPGADSSAPATDADFDNNLLVAGTDFLIWQRNFGATSANNSSGDANQDMLVNASDLDVWTLQYGSSVSGGLALASSNAATSSNALVSQAETASLQLASLLAIFSSQVAEKAEANDAIFADETNDLLLFDGATELSIQLAGSNELSHEEAESTLGSQDELDESTTEVAFTILADRLV